MDWMKQLLVLSQMQMCVDLTFNCTTHNVWQCVCQSIMHQGLQLGTTEKQHAELCVCVCGCAGLCCCRWFLRRRANKRQMRYVDQYYNTVGYRDPATDYAVTGANAASLGSLQQNLKSDSMSSSHSMMSTNPAFDDSATAGTAAGAGVGAAALTRTVSNASSEPRGPNPNAGWLNRDGLASNPLYQGDRTRTPSVERPRRARAPVDASPLTGMTTQPNRMRGRVGSPDLNILE